MQLEEVISEFQSKFNVEVKQDKFSYFWAELTTEKLHEALSFLKDRGFTQLVTITGVDRPKEGVIELIYHLAYEEKPFGLLSLSVKIPRDEAKIKTAYFIYKSAYIYEREVYDLLGVKFEGHPELKRILLPEDVPEGIHPLRKDWKGNIPQLIHDKGDR